MYLFFDTETTGVPQNYKAPITEISNWPRMLQLGYLLISEDLRVAKQRDLLVRPDGFDIPLQATEIHGITREIAMIKGIDIRFILDEFIDDVRQSSCIVAHNLAYDRPVIGCELNRYYTQEIAEQFMKYKGICTMIEATGFCGGRWPKLQDLHHRLFNKNFAGAHDAINDVKATANCFFRLKKMGVIRL